jgi:4-hydroxy-4-methyl-2-oxoglutarate aldolase
LATTQVAQAAAKRIEKEQQTRTRLADGELGLDMYGLRAKLDQLGVQWVDA